MEISHVDDLDLPDEAARAVAAADERMQPRYDDIRDRATSKP